MFLASGLLVACASLAGLMLVPGVGELCATVFAVSTFLLVCAADAWE
jgi:hypothetical protein